MRKERHALAFERAAQLGLGEQPIDTEQGHGLSCLRKVRGEASRVVEVGPGNVLTGLIKRIDSSVELHNVSDVASLEAFASLF